MGAVIGVLLDEELVPLAAREGHADQEAALARRVEGTHLGRGRLRVRDRLRVRLRLRLRLMVRVNQGEGEGQG